jgi:hypothetical protein
MALVLGSYRPSDLLYYFEGLNHYLDSHNGQTKNWMTPGAVHLRHPEEHS